LAPVIVEDPAAEWDLKLSQLWINLIHLADLPVYDRWYRTL
jgi:hypothetical protein